MSLRSRLGWGLHSLIQAYYRRQVDARVLAYSGQRTIARAYAPQFVDLVRLTRFVRQRRPAVLWEYGSGWSTQFLAQAVADNGTGRLYSIDAAEEWAANARAMLPPWLEPWAEIHHAAAERTDVGGTCAWTYRYRPEALPQFIYLDGPANVRDCPGNADLIEIEAQLAPGCLIVIDGRATTVEFLRAHFRRQWRYWEDMGPVGRHFSQFNQRYLELQR